MAVMILATNFKTDSAKTQKYFSRFVIPALNEYGVDDVISVERCNSALEKKLDLACVDAVGDYFGALVAIASRIVQVKPYGGDYDCFSVRDSRSSGAKTEYEKLHAAIKIQSLRPMIHCQTFIDEDEQAATCAIVRTGQLISFLACHEPKYKFTRDGTKFALAYWDDLRREGVKVAVFRINADGKKIAA